MSLSEHLDFKDRVDINNPGDAKVTSPAITGAEHQLLLNGIQDITKAGNKILENMGLGENKITIQDVANFIDRLGKALSAWSKDLELQEVKQEAKSTPQESKTENPKFSLKDAVEIVDGKEKPVDKLTPGNHTLKFKVDGKEREFDIYIPKGYDGKTELPMVMVFHGMSDKHPKGLMARETGMNEKADKENFIAVYPVAEPSGKGFTQKYSWNLLGDVKNSNDNLKYVQGILDITGQAEKIDKNSLAAVGFSEGGLMVNTLASKMPDKFSIIGSVGGTVLEGQKQIVPGQKPTDVFIVNNLDDKTILPYKGGGGTLSGPMGAIIGLNHLKESRPEKQVEYYTGKPSAEKPAEKLLDGKLDKYVSEDKTGKIKVTEYRVKGEHAWHGIEPGGKEGVGVKFKDFSVTEAFLKQWKRNPVIQRELVPNKK